MINEKLCRFYSPNWLSELLVESVCDLVPASVIDLGCGPGSLSDAAASRWPAARITTVDVDPAIAALRLNASECCNHVVRNVLADGLPRAAGIEPGTLDLAISNPPYTRVRRNRSLNRIMDRAGLTDAEADWPMVSVDLAFLAQALILVRSGGTLAFIVPDTFVSGEAMEPIRRRLIENHCVRTVIQLPRRTFGRTDALAFIVVIEKDGQSGTIKLSAVDEAGNFETNIDILASYGALRLDCLYHAANAAAPGKTTLGDLGVVVTRGRPDSRQVASSGGNIFHTGNFPDRPGGSISLAPMERCATSGTGVIAEAGDILLARVDRRLECKVAMVGHGAAEISDCVLRLRVPPQVRQRVLAGLISEDGRRQIVATSRGTGPRHISYNAVLSIRV